MTRIRNLDISPTVETRPSYVYAASGLVRLRDQLYVVADDELQLAVFDRRKNDPGKWIRLMPGVLSNDYKERKKEKPDLESITYLPPYQHAPDGALLVVPSMSRKNRINGVVLLLNKQQEPTEAVLPIDFSELRKKLDTLVAELNIEGIVVDSKVVKLFHRGSKGKSKSTVIELDAAAFLKDLHDEHVIGADHVIGRREYDLGAIKDVPLQFTDAVQMPDERILFLATAENTESAFDDGASFGSAAGIMDKTGIVERLVTFESTEKLEGVSADLNGNSIELLLVSDTDDQTKPAGLFQASLVKE